MTLLPMNRVGRCALRARPAMSRQTCDLRAEPTAMPAPMTRTTWRRLRAVAARLAQAFRRGLEAYTRCINRGHLHTHCSFRGRAID